MPQYEEASHLDSRGQDQKEPRFDPKIFEQFKTECEQDMLARVEQMDVKHVEYSGHLSRGNKDGKGHHYDRATGSFYYGAWSSGTQHGYGIKFFGKKSKIAKTGIQMLRRPDDDDKQEKQTQCLIWPMVYKGNWARGVFHGDGLVKFSNGLIVLGNFQDGHLRDGRDIQVMHQNGDVYIGQHINLVKHGYGQYYFKETGAKYKGAWKDNMKHGKGTLVFASAKKDESLTQSMTTNDENRVMMKGTFVNDQFQSGELHDAAGNVFTSQSAPDGQLGGHFRNDRLCGLGHCVYSGGDRYQGRFQGGKRSGHGIMVFSQFNELLQSTQESTYEGNWKLNQRSGYGVMLWPDGTRFEGQWLNDERHHGKQTMTDQNVYEGEFQNDKFHGVGKITFTREQLTFEGLFQ